MRRLGMQASGGRCRVAAALISGCGLVCLSTGAMAQWAPVPPPRFEAPPPPPPRPGLAWRRGAWDWDGRAYVWRPGQYVAYGPRYHRWVPGHWSGRGGVPVWIPAHWR